VTTIQDGAVEMISAMLAEKDDIIDAQAAQFDEIEGELELALDDNAAKDAIIAEKDEIIASLVAQLARMAATLQTE